MAHNTFPDPAAVHPGEREMLAAVLADLTDDLPKLVYADWLEERGDPRGPFLRAFTTSARSGGKLPKPKKLSKAWVDLIGCRAVAAVRECELPLTPDELLRDAQPALTFASKKMKDASLPVGVSKFGGDPDAPAKFRWPRYDDQPLAFLAQFNLAELSVSPAFRELPSDGLLSVFYARSGEVFDSSDKGGWKVYLFPSLTGLTRQAPPSDFDQEDRSPACRLAFTERLWLPEGTDFPLDALHTIYQQSVRHTDLSHQLLGGAEWLQGPADWAERKKAGRLRYRHLLTLDGDKNAGWSWGDAGLLYFGISVDDLTARRFDRTQFEFQCC